PRNLAQAEALDTLLSELGQPLDAVVQMDVDYGELMRRISGRRSCSDCGRGFNLFSPPADQIENATCPKTGRPQQLIQRPDHNKETVAERLKVYEQKTKPLIAFYSDRGLLQSINAEGDVDEITQRLESALRAATQAKPKRVARRKPAAKRKAAAKRSAGTKKTAGRKAGAGRGAATKRKATSGRKPAKVAAKKASTAQAKRGVARRATGKKT